LRQLYNKALDRLSSYYLTKGDYLQAILHLERLVRSNPLTEEYSRRLILAYSGIGDIKSINLQYQRLRMALREELGLSPSKEIQDLYSSQISSY
jgi:DNA-binding SARP family transcriptional activator